MELYYSILDAPPAVQLARVLVTAAALFVCVVVLLAWWAGRTSK